MAEYTSEEYTDIIIAYGIARENARAATRVYARSDSLDMNDIPTIKWFWDVFNTLEKLEVYY